MTPRLKTVAMEGINMEFLKAILGDDLYSQVEAAINSFNGNEANKANQVKLANLATGEYVGKGKYDALETQLNSKQTELDTANGLMLISARIPRAMKSFRPK